MPTDVTDWPAVLHQMQRLALALTRRRHEADDLTQSTIAALLAKAPDRIGHAGFARRTMLRLWLDEQRSMRRRISRVARLAANASTAWLARDSLTEAEAYERVEHAIAALPPMQRAALVLRLVEDLDYAEIAGILGTSSESVRSSLHLARGRVREMIGDEP